MSEKNAFKQFTGSSFKNSERIWFRCFRSSVSIFNYRLQPLCKAWFSLALISTLVKGPCLKGYEISDMKHSRKKFLLPDRCSVRCPEPTPQKGARGHDPPTTLLNKRF